MNQTISFDAVKIVFQLIIIVVEFTVIVINFQVYISHNSEIKADLDKNTIRHVDANALHVQNASRFAYVFYATTKPYACSALVNVIALQSTGVGPGIDIVLLHLKDRRGLRHRR